MTDARHDPDMFAPLPESSDWEEADNTTPRPDAPAAGVILPAPLPLPETIRHSQYGTPSHVWRYLDADGALLFAVCRFDTADGGKEILPFGCTAAGWRWKAAPPPRPLYGQDRLAALPDAVVLVVEGEKTADAAAALFPEYVAMTWPGGGNAVGKADWTPLTGRTVLVWPDADAAGAKAAAAVEKALAARRGTRVAVVPISEGWPPGWDLADFGKVEREQPEGVTLETLRDMAAKAESEARSRHTPPPSEAGDGKEDDERQSQRDKVVEAILETGATFWRDDTGEAFATIALGGTLHRYRVQGDAFRRAVRLIYGRRFMAGSKDKPRIGTASDQAMREALSAFDAMSLEGQARTSRVRNWLAPDGSVWLDLGDESWRLIQVSADGWRVVDQADVPIIRPAGVKALPLPVRSDTALDDLRRLANVPTEADFRLLVSWMLAALYPRGPYAIVAIDGEQGSGKSTVTRMIRELLDPNAAGVQPMPHNERDVILSCGNGLILALDNLSNISPEMADVLCRVATGTGLRARKLYSNGDEYIAQVQNPVLLNGIPALLSRADLADRALTMTLPAIADDKRQTEAAMEVAFRRATPGILAILLDGLSLALRNKDGLKLGSVPRMSDFAHLACAAAPAFGWTADDVLDALHDNRAAAVNLVIDADAVASAVLGLATDKGRWSGPTAALLAEINNRTPDVRQRERDWPKDATRLSKALRRIAPALRRVGVEVDIGREAKGRWVKIVLTKGPQRHQRHSASSASSGGPDPAAGDDASDAGDANDATSHFSHARPSAPGWSGTL